MADNDSADSFPDEQRLIGVLATDFRRLVAAERKGLRPEDFRHKLHAELYHFVVQYAAEGWSKLHVEASRLVLIGEGEATVGKASGYLAKLVRTHGIEPGGPANRNCADSDIELLAARIIAGIRNKQDCAIWFDQLQAACSRREIGASEYMIGVGIGKHLNYKTGRSFPGQALLAREWGAGLRTVERATVALRDLNHLHIDAGRPLTFVPIVWSKVDAASVATARRAAKQAAAKALPAAPAHPVQSRSSDLDDEIPF
jgi:hypothetical protein